MPLGRWARAASSANSAPCAPHTEIDRQFARRGQHAVRHLGGDQGLKVQASWAYGGGAVTRRIGALIKNAVRL